MQSWIYFSVLENLNIVFEVDCFKIVKFLYIAIKIGYNKEVNNFLF